MRLDWRQLFAEPLAIRAIVVLLGLLAIFLAVRLIQHSVTQGVEVPQARYRIRKLVALGGYLSIALFISLVFSDQLRHLAVAFGVIGGGIAFALQEVIASLGGWVAITLGRYYRLGDRIMINGLLGDVIDMSPLRTTLMECGGWVGADLCSGRIVRIANSSALVIRSTTTRLIFPIFGMRSPFPSSMGATLAWRAQESTQDWNSMLGI